ncbi:hypothetical protein EDC01DRAFT_635396 [Geopyxis carbonaria]|nr:hypothetical protein EDC01DRAFT_635396 [Geopyxis carbonaria]
MATPTPIVGDFNRPLFQRLANIYHYRLCGAWKTMAGEDVPPAYQHPPDVSKLSASGLVKLVRNFKNHLIIYPENIPPELWGFAHDLASAFDLFAEGYIVENGVARFAGMTDSRCEWVEFRLQLVEETQEVLWVDNGAEKEAALKENRMKGFNKRNNRMVVSSGELNARWIYFLLPCCFAGFLAIIYVNLMC